MSETETTAPAPEKSAVASKAKAKTTPSRKPSQGNGGAFFATVVALAAIAIGYYLWQQQQLAEHKLAAIEGSLERLLDAVEQQHQRQLVRIDTLGRGQPAQEQRLSELEQQLQRLRGHLSRQAQEWELAEVDYLLRIAEHRLQLEGHPIGALRALHSAAATLASAEDRAFEVLLGVIEADIQRLSSLPVVDRQVLASQLTELESHLAGLKPRLSGGEIQPLPGAEPKQEASSGWRGLLQRIWQDLRELVVIRYQEDGQSTLPAPGQVENLQWMLQIRLETARLALMANRQGLWEESLQRALDGLTKYFDADNPAYQQLEQGLQALSVQPLQQAVPSLQPTITLLENLVLQPEAEQLDMAPAIPLSLEDEAPVGSPDKPVEPESGAAEQGEAGE